MFIRHSSQFKTEHEDDKGQWKFLLSSSSLAQNTDASEAFMKAVPLVPRLSIPSDWPHDFISIFP